LAATANTQSDSLVVTGISTLGIVTNVTSIGVVEVFANSVTASEIHGNSDGADTILAVTDTTSTTGRRVSFINDADTGVSNYETVNVGNLIWTPSSGNLSGVVTYSGQDVVASGNVTASTFVGDGSGLTGINAGIGTTGSVNTTGIVTASSFVGDGSGLTGVVGSGSGVIIENSGSAVGTAGTINFGDNLSVSALAGGKVTVTGVGTFSGNYNDLSNQPTIPTNNNQLTNGAGFITTSFTDTSQLANGAGFITNVVSGVLTATSFSGDGSALTGVTASGTGINISDSGSVIGVAGTINFATNLSVSPISAGVVTVTSASGSGSTDNVSTNTLLLGFYSGCCYWS